MQPPSDAFTLPQRDKAIAALLDLVMATLTSKAREYVDEVANQNFYDCAIGKADAIDVCALFLQKHMISIRRWVERRATPEGGESITGRIVDAIAYLGILHTLIVEALNETTEASQ